MRQPETPTLTFIPAGPSRFNFKLRLSKHYTLVGSYVDGVLQHIALRKRTSPATKEK